LLCGFFVSGELFSLELRIIFAQDGFGQISVKIKEIIVLRISVNNRSGKWFENINIIAHFLSGIL